MNRPLYQKIQDDLILSIKSGELAEGDLVPSEKELAERYNVSQITSKNAIRGLVEAGLLVRYRGRGTFVRSSGSGDDKSEGDQREPAAKERMIALVLPAMKTKIDQGLLDSLERNCAEAGYDLLIRITRESPSEEEAAIAKFRDKGVDGFIIFPVEQESYSDAILRLSLDRVPLVLVDRFLKEIKTYSVSSDNAGGVKEAIASLIEEGHRRIAYLSPEITNTATDERARGYEQAFTEKGMPIDKSIWCMLRLDSIAEGKGQEIIERFLKEHPDVTAIMAVNAELARYAQQARKALYGGDGAAPVLVAFDEPDLEQVSYIRQQMDAIGRLTVELLTEQLSGQFIPRREVVPVEYIRP